MDYANENSIILKINVHNKNGDFPLLLAANNNKMVKLLMDYANRTNIILGLNDKNEKK